MNVLQGVIKAVGKETAMLWIYGITYYPICLPITIYIAFHLEYYTRGLWMGFLISVVLVDTQFIILLCCTDLNKQIQSIRMSLKAQSLKRTLSIKAGSKKKLNVEDSSLKINRENDTNPSQAITGSEDAYVPIIEDDK